MKFFEEYDTKAPCLGICTANGRARVKGYHIKGEIGHLKNYVDLEPLDANSRHLTETEVQEIDLNRTEPSPVSDKATTLHLQAEEGKPFVLKLNGCNIRCQGIDIHREDAQTYMTVDIRGLYIDEAVIEVGDDDE